MPTCLRKWITKFLMEREKGILPIQHASDDAASPDEVDSVTIDQPDSRELVATAAALPRSYRSFRYRTAPVPTPPHSSMALALHVRPGQRCRARDGQSHRDIDELTTLVQILGRMPCSGSTKT